MAKDDQQETESRHELGDPLGDAGSLVNRGLDEGQREHGMCEDRTGAATKDLHQYVGGGFAPGLSTAKCLDQRHSRIEVSAAHRPEERD